MQMFSPLPRGAFPGVDAPLGVIGVSEKGAVSLRLTASGRGGHASTPAKGGPAARIATAITRLERRPFAAALNPPTAEMMRRLGPHLPAPLRPLVERADRLAPALARAMVAAGDAPTAADLRRILGSAAAHADIDAAVAAAQRF